MISNKKMHVCIYVYARIYIKIKRSGPGMLKEKSFLISEERQFRKVYKVQFKKVEVQQRGEDTVG